MTVARILSTAGSGDGLRFGDVRFGPVIRRYVHDRLSGEVSLYAYSGGAGRYAIEDLDVERRQAALAAIQSGSAA